MCPGFAADCLETLEEIAEQNREVFLGAGEKYEYIPALNATPEHIEMMANLVAAYR
ncbi:ferrochelatase [Shigella flexneri]